jgi:DHA2 family multidrug resistance protein
MVCGLAPSFEIMILGRICQGLGGGCLLPLSQAILLESYPKERQSEAMGIFSIGVTIAPIIGPILGGWLTTDFAWNYVFFVSLPFCIASFVMISKFIEDPPYMKPNTSLKFDIAGFILLIIWISSFQIMVDNGQKNGWFDSPYICKLGITSLISFISLIWWELTNKEPLFDLRIFKNWNFTFGTIIITMVFGIAYGSIALLPQMLQGMMGYTSFLSGIAAAPMGVGTLMGAGFCSLTSKLDMRHQLFMGLVIFTVGCLMFSTLNLDIAMGNVILPNIVLGLGMTSVIIPVTTIIFSYVKNYEMTNASALQNLVKNVGCAVGTSSVGVLVSRYSQIYQSYLVDRLTMLNSTFAQRVTEMTSTFMSMGSDFVTAQHMAMGNIYKQLMMHSTISAYMNSYRIYALATMIVIPLVFILRKCNQEKSN